VRGDLALHRQEYRLVDDVFTGYNFDEDYVFLLPRLGATWKLRDDTELYGSWSRGEAEPIFRELYDPENVGVPPGFATLDPATGTLSDPLIDPEHVDDFALGVRVANPRGEATLGLYYMKFVDEIVYNGRIDDNGNPITGNAARSRHAGVEGSFTLRPARRLELGANFHVADDRFDEYLEYFDASTTTDYSGNRIAGFPGWAARGRAQVSLGNGAVDLAVDHAGRQYLDNTENERKNPALHEDPTWEDRTIEPWTAVNAGAHWTFPGALGGRAIELDLRVNNVFDERYETAGYVDYPDGVTATPVWIPAATRNVFAGVKATF
jgi:iron complex outermembrane receptor protein